MKGSVQDNRTIPITQTSTNPEKMTTDIEIDREHSGNLDIQDATISYDLQGRCFLVCLLKTREEVNKPQIGGRTPTGRGLLCRLCLLDPSTSIEQKEKL
jgi:hypothetical protein